MSNKNLEVALKIVAQATGKQHISGMVDELNKVASSSKDGGKEAAALANELETLANQQELINSFQKSSSELEKNELAVVAAAQALEKLQQEAKDTDKPFVQLAKAIGAAEDDLSQMRSELSKQTSKHKALQKQLEKSGVNSKNLTAKKRELAAEFTKTGKKIDSYKNKLKQGSAAEKAHAQNLDNITGKLVALTAAYVGLNQVSSAITDIFSTGDKFERLGIQMDALMGSIEGGDAATQWVKEFTANTPLQLSDVSKAFVKLKAFGLDPMDGTMQAITDQAFKLGGSFEEVEGISLALGQAWAKQKLQGEEILQLVERGIPVWDLLEKATGRNAVELQKMSSAGELGRDVIKKLIDEMGKDSVGSAEANMALLSGQISNAKDNIDQFYNLITESGAMDWLKAQLTAINTKFKEMTEDGSLQEWAQSISDTIVATGEAIKSTFTTLYQYKEEIAAVAKVWLALKVGNYFSNVVSGARTAITALASYRSSMVATETATKSATVTAGKWKKAVKFAGQATLYTALISQLVEIGFLYKDLLIAEQKAAESHSVMETQAAKLQARFKQLNSETNLNITSMAQFEKAVADGVLVWDEALERYQSAEQVQARLAESTRLAAQEEKQRQQVMTLTLEQAVNTVNQLEKQAHSLSGVRDGVQGFINAIDAAKTTLQGAGAEYSQQVELLDQLRDKYVAHNESLERQAYLAGDVAKAYETLGIKSASALEELAEKHQGAFELIQQSNEPIEMQEKAFLAWAKSAIEAADATGKIAPQSLEAAAAALGLSDELQKLIDKANKLKPVNDTNSDAFNRFKGEVEKTTEAIAKNQAIVDSSTASATEKKKAQELLTIQQARLKEETEDLNKVQELEVMNLSQLRKEQTKLEREMNHLNAQYKQGRILAQEYNDKKQRMGDMLKVVNDLLGDFKTSQDKATESTKKNTQATKESTEAVKETVKERNRLIQTYNEETEAANKAQESKEYHERQKNQANAKTIVEFEDSNNIPEHLRNKSQAVEDYRREKTRLENLEKLYYQKLEQAQDSTKTIAELEALYKQTASLRAANFDNEKIAQLQALIQENIKAQKEASNAKATGDRQTVSYTSEPINSELIQKITELIDTLNNRTSSFSRAPGRTVRLELIIGGETFKAELLEEFEELFLSKLEQAGTVI